MEIVYSQKAQDDIAYWKQYGNDKTRDKIQKLIREIGEMPYSGTGKPEPLKYGLSGCWSRRINRVDRIVYEVSQIQVHIHSLRGHYE